MTSKEVLIFSQVKIFSTRNPFKLCSIVCVCVCESLERRVKFLFTSAKYSGGLQSMKGEREVCFEQAKNFPNMGLHRADLCGAGRKREQYFFAFLFRSQPGSSTPAWLLCDSLPCSRCGSSSAYGRCRRQSVQQLYAGQQTCRDGVLFEWQTCARGGFSEVRNFS